jgi:hypothetical protein
VISHQLSVINPLSDLYGNSVSLIHGNPHARWTKKMTNEPNFKSGQIYDNSFKYKKLNNHGHVASQDKNEPKRTQFLRGPLYPLSPLFIFN